MGCHTWFSRPVTKEELEVFKSHALEDAWSLWGETDFNVKYNCVDMKEYLRVKESVKNNTDYWWRHGYGTVIEENGKIKRENTDVINGILHIDLSDHRDNIFDLKRYHDVFRVKNYPRTIIHSRLELRRWMKKRYFELEEWQLEKISEFFRENPGGIITFG